MLDNLFLATVTFGFIYFVVAFVCYSRDRIVQRHRNLHEDRFTKVLAKSKQVAVVEAIAEPTEHAMIKSESCPLVVPTRKKPLIAFIQKNNLQSAIFSITGKTYSKVNLISLREAVLQAIA